MRVNLVSFLAQSGDIRYLNCPPSLFGLTSCSLIELICSHSFPRPSLSCPLRQARWPGFEYAIV